VYQGFKQFTYTESATIDATKPTHTARANDDNLLTDSDGLKIETGECINFPANETYLFDDTFTV